MTEDVFEITDFTTASDWERFVSDLEEVITRWQLCGKDSSTSELTADELTRGLWTQKHETIRFSKTTFSLVFHKLQETLPNKESKEHKQPKEEKSVCCSAAALDGQRVQMDWPSRAHCAVRYFGLRCFLVMSAKDDSIANEDRLRLLLSSATMALSATHCALPLLVEWSRARRLLAGVSVTGGVRTDLQMVQSARNSRFKHLSSLLEVMRSETQSETPIQVSIRLTFALNRFPAQWIFRETQRPGTLSSVTSCEPLLELQVAAVWPSLAEDAVIDSENHSDLDPNSSQKWTLRAVFRDAMECPLSEALASLLSLRNDENPILDQMLEQKDIKDAFIALTNDCPQEKWIRDLVRDFVFQKKPEEEEEEQLWSEPLKCAPIGSLSSRVAICVSNVFSSSRGSSGSRGRQIQNLRLLWREIVVTLRKSWEASRVLPHCGGAPDLNCALFHQKLQMLNTCIDVKSHANDDSDDEFFDAREDQTEQQKPEGRLALSKWKRVSDPSQAIWVPQTQEAPPLTEDMVSEQLAVLQRLGTSAQSATLRARLQSAGLVSDMEAFKAANVGAAFEDFVRWHSPRDCEADGQLSARFSTPDNVWREVWLSARAVPARRQKPLFDATTEAEKVLHFLAALTFGDLADLVIPLVVDCCLFQMRDKPWTRALDTNHVATACQQKQFEPVVNAIRAHETHVLRCASLRHKLNVTQEESGEHVPTEAEITRLAEQLVSEPEVHVDSFGAFGRLVRRLFAQSLSEEETRDPWEPVAREFVLRVWSRRPCSYSRELPQRLYCSWSETDVRLASAFSRDCTYF